MYNVLSDTWLENVPAVESHNGQTYLESAKETKNVALAYRIGTDHFFKKGTNYHDDT
jgi:hypothetical protein